MGKDCGGKIINVKPENIVTDESILLHVSLVDIYSNNYKHNKKH